MRIQGEGHTSVGRRENNEDSLLMLPSVGFYAVADGMGGYEGGEVASKLALASLQAYFDLLGEDGLGDPADDPEGELAFERLGLAIRIAHREVVRRATGRLAQMGTTLACLAVQGERAVVAHVGDSRVYRLREGDVQVLTQDHSLLAEMLASGATTTASSEFSLRNIITQAVGQGPSVRPDLTLVDVLPGDRFLICSDGLSDVLSNTSIARGLSRSRDVAESLCRAAYEAGSADNITALVVHAD